MFSLNGAVKYKYIPNYKDMRGGYDKLSGVVRSLGHDPEDGISMAAPMRRIQEAPNPIKAPPRIRMRKPSLRMKAPRPHQKLLQAMMRQPLRL